MFFQHFRRKALLLASDFCSKIRNQSNGELRNPHLIPFAWFTKRLPKVEILGQKKLLLIVGSIPPRPHELWWFVGLAYHSRYHHFYHFLSTFSRIKVVRILQKLETALSTWGQNLNLLSCSCHSIGGKCLRRSKRLLKFCFCVTFTGSTNTGPDLTQPCPSANLAKGGKKETMHLNSTSSSASSSSSSAPWRHAKGWERIAFGLEEAASRPESIEQVQTWIRIFDTCI